MINTLFSEKIATLANIKPPQLDSLLTSEVSHNNKHTIISLNLDLATFFIIII